MTDITTEIFHSGVWHDISADVYNRDVIPVTRGAQDESSGVKAGRMRLTLDNRTGRYSPRNPRSDLFGLIGRNTPARVTVDGSIRFAGEVASWPQGWSPSGADVFTQTEAAGILRRLGQGASPLRSALTRHVSTLSERIRAYFPFEDGAGSTQIMSGVGGDPSPVNPPVSFSSVDVVPGSERVALFEDGSMWRGPMATPEWITASTGWRADWLWRMDEVASPHPGALVVLTCNMSLSPVVRWTVSVAQNNARVRAFGDDDVVLFDELSPSLSSDLLFASWIRWSFRVSQSGGNIQFAVEAFNLDGPEPVLFVDFGSNTLLAGSPGRVVDVGPGFSIGLNARSWAHVAVSDQFDLDPLTDDVISGFSGETAADRIIRLSLEENVSTVIVGDPALSTAMGAQLPRTFLDLVREAEAADQGILYEARESISLAYRTRGDLYNQEPAFALTYGDGMFRSEPAPIDDDQLTRNDITVTRQGGSSARLQLASGALSVQPPPGGVGRYDEGLTVNLAGDGQLLNDVSWRLSLGTVDEARYPNLHLQLIAPAYAADSELTAEVAALDIGDRIVIDNPPEWLPPEQISVLVQGFTETLSLTGRDIVINTAPESPYRVGVYAGAGQSVPADAAQRYSSAGTVTTASFVAGTATALAVETLIRPYWTTDTANMPFDILVAGVRLRVTAISAPSGDFQTMTVQQTPINGIVKTIPAVSVVALFQPAVYAL